MKEHDEVVDLISAKDVAEILRIPERTVLTLARAGKIEAYRFTARLIRFDRKAVVAYLESSRRSPEARPCG